MSKDTLSNLKSPKAIMRPGPFWSWNDKLDEAELRRQIREMADKGWGSYFMHSRVGLVTGYLSEEWMGLINACADEAEKTGTYAWLYDEDKWPSGFAGGEVPEMDESFRMRGLALVRQGTVGPQDTVLSSVQHGGVNFNICKRVKPLGEKWYNGACYVDLMNPEAVRAFIDCTHERYKVACGRHFGKSIPGIFTDEPQYSNPWAFDVPTVPWSDYLPGFFKEMKGYDITEHLAKLFFDIGDYRKVRFDFYDAASELFKQSWTKQYYDWCEANGLIMTGHFMQEDDLVCQVQFCGDVMTHYEFMHWPGTDKLGRNIDQIVACKQVSSVVDQLGKERAFCEVFGCMGGQCSFFTRKWIGDWQAALGISFVNHHLSLYSMRGERKRDYPANLFYQQPWWDDERGMADYQARLCAAVSEGERIVDVLVIQPMASVWSEYSPLHSDDDQAAARVYDKPFTAISRRLMEEKIDYHIGNESLMAKHASVENDRLKVGGHSYKCVVVPPTCNVKSSTLSLLRQFAKQGGNLIFTGEAPRLVDGVGADAGVPEARIATSLREAVKLAGEAVPGRITITDKLTGGNAPKVFVHSRKLGGSTRHLIVNTDDKREVRAVVDLAGWAGSGAAVLDLYDGNLYKLVLGGSKFEATLAPAGSLLVICGEEAGQATSEPPAVLGSGACFVSFAKKTPAAVVEGFECEVLEDNVMLLNNFALELDGKRVYEGPICGAWHTHFYPASDGIPFKVTYTFHSECEVDGCFAAIEVAENLDSITFNGHLVKPLKERGELGALDVTRSWKDINFTRVPLPSIMPGMNTLVIGGRKVNNITDPGSHERVPDWRRHEPTEAEEVYICGRFNVKQLSNSRYGIAPFAQPSGVDMNAEGFPFYCGRIRLKGSFDLTGKPAGSLFLQLVDAAMASASVSINGIDCGALRWKPHVVEITKAARPGTNEVTIEMATTLVNCFGPNRMAGIEDSQWVGPHEFQDMSRFTNRYQLFDFGLGSAAVFALE